MTSPNKFNERMARLDCALNLREPDRVPFAPKMSLFYTTAYGISAYDIMKDFRLARPGIKSYVDEFDPDLVWPPAVYPIDPLEALGTTMLRWPGPTHGLPLNSSFQHLDNTYLLDDEFNEFLADPSGFFLRKVLPRKHASLKGLSKIRFNDVYDMSFIMSLAAFDDPDVIEAVFSLLHAGKHVKDKVQQAQSINEFIIRDCGCPVRGTTLCAPFDAYADSLRGFVQTVMDISEFPDETLACVNRIADLYIDRDVQAAARRGEKFIFIPLHAGMDDFMSPANYEKFYWPTLKRLIDCIVTAGMVPYVFCEGKYDTRLETISDVPKGKVIYMFEQVNIANAKKIVGQTACIGGNMPTTLLINGTPEQVISETRRMLEICAPGGGFIMDDSLIIDNASHANMLAWREATLRYGVY